MVHYTVIIYCYHSLAPTAILSGFYAYQKRVVLLFCDILTKGYCSINLRIIGCDSFKVAKKILRILHSLQFVCSVIFKVG